MCDLFAQREARALHPTVNWVAHARFVVDGKYWTSSGVSAGMDLASAFVDRMAGKGNSQSAENIRGMLEYTCVSSPPPLCSDVCV